MIRKNNHFLHSIKDIIIDKEKDIYLEKLYRNGKSSLLVLEKLTNKSNSTELKEWYALLPTVTL